MNSESIHQILDAVTYDSDTMYEEPDKIFHRYERNALENHINNLSQLAEDITKLHSIFKQVIGTENITSNTQLTSQQMVDLHSSIYQQFNFTIAFRHTDIAGNFYLSLQPFIIETVANIMQKQVKISVLGLDAQLLSEERQQHLLDTFLLEYWGFGNDTVILEQFTREEVDLIIKKLDANQIVILGNALRKLCNFMISANHNESVTNIVCNCFMSFQDLPDVMEELQKET